MDIFLFVAAALTAYLVAGWNPAITFSLLIYKQDIRTCGSKNPGFTNFKRSFGNKWAWWVLALDLSKAAVVVILYAVLFDRFLKEGIFSDNFQFGAAYTGFFAMIGHAFPVWYKFKGGKGFLVCLSTVFVIDWKVGLAATLLMVVLLLTTKYMSLSTVCAILLSPVLMAFLGTEIYAIIIFSICAVFMTVRHLENFKRLFSGTESKFYLKSKK